MIETTDFQNYLPLVVGVLLPALVALVTKQVASSRFKSLALLALSAVSSALYTALGSAELNLQNLVNTFLVTFGAGVLSYYGVLKPTGVTENIQNTIPGGVGPVPELPGPEFDPADVDPNYVPEELPGPGEE